MSYNNYTGMQILKLTQPFLWSFALIKYLWLYVKRYQIEHFLPRLDSPVVYSIPMYSGPSEHVTFLPSAFR